MHFLIQTIIFYKKNKIYLQYSKNVYKSLFIWRHTTIYKEYIQFIYLGEKKKSSNDKNVKVNKDMKTNKQNT